MPMDRNEFLNAIIDDGIHEIETTYLRPDQELKRSGGIKGFNVCRGKTDQELLDALDLARKCTAKSQDEGNVNTYWHWVMYERQIEWTLNVLSAGLMAQGRPPLTDVTMRGYLKAADILGVEAST